MSSLFSAYQICRALVLPTTWADDTPLALTTSGVRLEALDRVMLKIEAKQAESSPEAIRARAEARREELRICIASRRANAALLRLRAEELRKEAREKRKAEQRLLEAQNGQAQAFERVKAATLAKARQLRGLASNWAARMRTQLQGGILWAQTWLTHWNQEAMRTMDAIPAGTVEALREAARELESRARWLSNGTDVLVMQYRGMI